MRKKETSNAQRTEMDYKTNFSFKIIVSAFFIFISYQTLLAQTGSTNRDAPTPLTTNLLQGRSARSATYYYNFIAGPGNVRITMDGRTDYYAVNVAANLFYLNGEKIESLIVTANGTGSRQVKNVNFPERQYVLIQLVLEKDSAVKFIDYKIRLEGAVNFDKLNYSGDNSSSSSSKSAGDFDSLTGVWKCDDGATYYIRVIGDEVWWFGRGKDFTNVFYGKFEAWGEEARFVGKWADVPPGSSKNSGTISISVFSNNKLTKIRGNANFAGKEWIKQ